jgi:Holliday junction resolvase
MGRSRSAAKDAGRRTERETADALKEHVSEFIDRRVKTGAKDKGDIVNLRTPGGNRIAVECKNVAKMSLGTWVNEAEAERINDEAIAGIVVHNRVGKGNPLDQYVSMTLRDLVAILTDKRPD